MGRNNWLVSTNADFFRRGEEHTHATTYQVRRMSISTNKTSEAVKSDIESKLRRPDDSFRILLAENRIEELRPRLEEASQPRGLMIHYVATHGDCLALSGERRPGIVYRIGNVLLAIQMTQHAFGASFAPGRIRKRKRRHNVRIR